MTRVQSAQEVHNCLLTILVCLNVFFVSAGYASEAATNPAFSLSATRGLSQTISAESMGAGRMTINIIGSWYKQDQEYLLSPNSDASILTGGGAFSFGVNSYIDLHTMVLGFGTMNYTGAPRYGLGSISLGILGTLPIPEQIPFRLGADLSLIGGTAGNQLNTNRMDGYNYFETRTSYDFCGKFLQSLVWGDENKAFKIHLNEGVATTLGGGQDALLLLALGLQGNVHPIIVLGMEVNSRTLLKDPSIPTDPLWLTPSIQFRTPFYMNFMLGGDISLCQTRSDPAATKALESFRLWGGMSFSFDLLAGKRKAAKDKEQQTADEKQKLTKEQSQLRAEVDSLARKMKQDSIVATQQRLAERRRADSLMQRAKADSLALYETQKRLDEERSKRTDAEKMLLTTGMLLLDAVYFESGKTEISINSKPYLNIIAKMLVKYPKLAIEVDGHTDSVGKFEFNKRLSYARAESVRRYLSEVAPELASRLTAIGYGPERPKADNTSAEGRKINRRVELQVLNKNVLKEYNP
jgi:outer membrane protein OmpA-like peptidoglycan-associated protein